jgi:hypothetical protein
VPPRLARRPMSPVHVIPAIEAILMSARAIASILARPARLEAHSSW